MIEIEVSYSQVQILLIQNEIQSRFSLFQINLLNFVKTLGQANGNRNHVGAFATAIGQTTKTEYLQILQKGP